MHYYLIVIEKGGKTFTEGPYTKVEADEAAERIEYNLDAADWLLLAQLDSEKRLTIL